jgi:hypothetical protein
MRRPASGQLSTVTYASKHENLQVIGQVGEADVQLITAQAFVEEGNVEAGGVVVPAHHGPEVDGGQARMP